MFCDLSPKFLGLFSFSLRLPLSPSDAFPQNEVFCAHALSECLGKPLKRVGLSGPSEIAVSQPVAASPLSMCRELRNQTTELNDVVS